MITTFSQILIAFDGSASSSQALDMALLMAKTFTARVSLVHVVNAENGVQEAELQEKVRQKSIESGINIHYISKKGKVFKEIVHAAKEINADLIVMGAHGLTGFQEFWIGSNAFRVASSSRCPVISMQENFSYQGFRNIVLPLDDSRETRQKIPYAVSMAKYFNATVNILAVSRDNSNEVSTRIKTYAYQAQNFLEEKGIKTAYELSQGKNVATATIEYAERVNADLIMFMTEAESPGLFTMGTYAQQIINNARIPVMTIPPKDLEVSYAQL